MRIERNDDSVELSEGQREQRQKEVRLIDTRIATISRDIDREKRRIVD